MAWKTFYSANFSENDIFVWYPHIVLSCRHIWF